MLDFVDVIKFGIGFFVCGFFFFVWVLIFVYGGEELFGVLWKFLVVYDIVEKYV